ncbi:hypothetical protein ACFUTV_39670 [Streptomyces sp. NPDC057298]|uniref:hypothetical protein n=1 Tax=Streptomyces sp. NPDC057298 TaxID=3346091 RepID=UPI00362B0CE7
MHSIVDRLIGPERAARVIQPLVRELMADDLLLETVAYRIVCEGVLAGDPWLLAEPGQGWALRSDVTDPAPALLVIVRRDTDQLTVEDPYGQRHQIPGAQWPPTSWSSGAGCDRTRTATPTRSDALPSAFHGPGGRLAPRQPTRAFSRSHSRDGQP